MTDPVENIEVRPRYDAVIMLTWSDWHLEARSNRYHYATRFARSRPVYFVQPDGFGQQVTSEKVPGQNIEVVHVRVDDIAFYADALTAFFRDRGVRQPLIWIYNPAFCSYVALTSAALRVYHATEDYFSADAPLVTRIDFNPIAEAIRKCVAQCDAVVAVSDGVARHLRDRAGYKGHLIVLKNGCDFDFWHESGAFRFESPAGGAQIALYQGNLNIRVDYRLLMAVADALPHWQFWFCGSIAYAPPDWSELSARSNVRYLGVLSPENIADAARHARVGLIPFVQADYIAVSLPLKAYEYLACGMPVVTVPIRELTRFPQVFTEATTPEEFAISIETAAVSRDEPQAVSERLRLAKTVSYDTRFQDLTAALEDIAASIGRRGPRLNVLMLIDERSLHVKTIQEHLDGFENYSRHHFYFLSATGPHGADTIPFDFKLFDAVVIHYCVRLSLAAHLSPDIAASLAAYNGPKLLFIQDEYDTTETARRWIERLGIDAVFTNVPEQSLEHVYPRDRFPTIDFIPTLTGYVPEDPVIDSFALPLQERGVLIGYRGRKLPHHYGQLGFDKFRIGVEVKRFAEARHLPVDIEVDDSRRIYGEDWYRFLGSCRATLGTESGSNVFDDNGAIAALATQHADLDFNQFSERFLTNGEGPVRMNQVSPKIFEAARLRTALVLFEGSYSGTVQAHKHFIPLKHDFSNIDEVFTKLQDIPSLEAMTERTYSDVVESGRYSLSHFVSGVDKYLDVRARGRRRAALLSAPLMAITESGEYRAVLRNHSLRFIWNHAVPETVIPQNTIYNTLRAWGSEIFPPLVSLHEQTGKVLIRMEAEVAARATEAERNTQQLTRIHDAISQQKAEMSELRAEEQRTQAALNLVARRVWRPVWMLPIIALGRRMPSSMRNGLLRALNRVRASAR